jgi:hypothetical protein
VADTFQLEVTRDELAAFASLIGAAQAIGLAEQIEREFGEEYGVAYASLILKFAILERQAVPSATPEEDAEALATFVADLDQRRAALAEEQGQG